MMQRRHNNGNYPFPTSTRKALRMLKGKHKIADSQLWVCGGIERGWVKREIAILAAVLGLSEAAFGAFTPILPHSETYLMTQDGSLK